MLTLTPCVCVLSAIAFSTLFERYLKEDDVGGSNNETNVSNGNGKYLHEILFRTNCTCIHHRKRLPPIQGNANETLSDIKFDHCSKPRLKLNTK